MSLALAIRGVHYAVGDPRRTVGKLPGRDRKELKKSNLVPFSTNRAWFGLRPQGVDSFFREGNTYDNEYVQKTLANRAGIPSMILLCFPFVQCARRTTYCPIAWP